MLLLNPLAVAVVSGLDMNSRPTMMSSLMKTLTPSQRIRNLVNVNNHPPFAWNSVYGICLVPVFLSLTLSFNPAGCE
ncbi:hypothetical protein JMJ78_0002302, partial [Colletotrichum scovillei]